jgi:hypothetical protein
MVANTFPKTSLYFLFGRKNTESLSQQKLKLVGHFAQIYR